MKSYIFIYILLVTIFLTSCSTQECDCGEPVNVWYKVSTDSISLGQVIKLDMTAGQSFSDANYIYIIVRDLENGENVVIAFPNGGDWVAQTQDPFLDALDKEFKDLEDYLRATKDKSSEIKKKQ